MIWTLLPLLLGLILAERRCRQQLRRLLPNGSHRNRIEARLLPDILILIALVIIVTSLQPSQSATRDNREAPAIALVVDVSRSMGVKDAYPDRLALAKRELLSLVKNLSGARFALIPFAGEAVVQVPLTSDREGLRFFINNLHTGLVASKGSAPEEAILLAQKSLKNISGERLIVLLTDGERTVADQPPPLSGTIPVYSIMLGTTAGGEVDNLNGAISQSDPARLTAITRQTGGKSLNASASSPALFDLPIQQTTAATKKSNSTLLLIALFLILLRWASTALPGSPIFGLALLLLTFLTTSCQNETNPSRQSRSYFEAGMQAAHHNDIDSALRSFALATKNLDGEQRGIALYNHGTLLLDSGQTDNAINLFEQALILMPGDKTIRENLLLALAQSNSFKRNGNSDSKATETDDGEEMSPQQAQQLIDTVRLDPTAPPAEATIRPLTVLKEW